jgi:flagellar biosynthesis/type III secretory pathway chaperone
MQPSLENELAALLSDLLAGQDELLAILTKKRQLLGAADTEGLAAIGPQEQRWIDALQVCLQRRQELLARAAAEGLPAKNIKAMAERLPSAEGQALRQRVELARRRSRLLQQQNLVNWVVVQRTLLHLSQLLEIIATGGRLQPTYGERRLIAAGGALVDQAV